VPRQPEAGERYAGQQATEREQRAAEVIAQLQGTSMLETDLQKRQIVTKKRMTPFF
jgi:hypothetical protein